MLRTSLLLSAFTAGPLLAEGAFVDHFKSLDASRWHVAEYDFDHPSFDTDWRKKNAVFSEGLQLKLKPHEGGKNRFSSASLRTHDSLHYGHYSTRLRAARGPGLVTGVFTYTGPYYGTRHDEIDIEILGRDTTTLHVAWFVNGMLTEHDIPLGFDAAEGLHRYGFTWRPDRISWFVDDQLVFEVTDHQAPLPQVPGRFFANLWAADPSIASWAGQPRADQTAVAHVQELSFEPLEQIERLAMNRR